MADTFKDFGEKAKADTYAHVNRTCAKSERQDLHFKVLQRISALRGIGERN